MWSAGKEGFSIRPQYILLITGILVIAFVGINTFFQTQVVTTQNPDKDLTQWPSIITNVDSILANPSHFTGYMGVEGKVVMVDEANSMFGLGCSDGCLILPVTCKGKIPGKDSEVIAYGEVKKMEGEGYIFESEKVTIK